MEIGKWFSFLVTVGSFCAARGLKCRTDDDSQHQDEFQEAAKQCMTNMSNWDRPSSTNSGGDYSGDQQQQGSYGGYGNGNNNQGQQQNNNQRHSSKPRSRRDNRGKNNNHNNNNNNNNNRNNNKNDDNSNSPNDSSDSSALQHVEPCIVHCIFRQMQMLDEDAMPDKVSVTNIMMRRVRDSRVKEFIEEAVDECFELMESENKGGKCEFSKNLAMCLEEKGRRNCEDWDVSESNKQNVTNMKGGNSRDSNNRERDPQEYSNDSK